MQDESWRMDKCEEVGSTRPCRSEACEDVRHEKADCGQPEAEASETRH
jgi:hypothetical protein